MRSWSFVNMYKYIVLCLCVSLSGVLCDLNKEEGAACEWDGVKGKCVKETQCLTTLDKRSDPHLVCSTKGDVTFVCCTDCKLVNDTRNVVISPKDSYYWKDGTKARDNCLQYLNDLPYKCREGGFYAGISKNYDENQKCHTIAMWGIGGSTSPGHKSGGEYPHHAMLGYGQTLATAEWLVGGAVISNKYILTAASVNNDAINKGNVKFIALGIEGHKGSQRASNEWQFHSVKRFIPHPDFKTSSYFNDIALIETETPIKFSKYVLPACLHVEYAADETAVLATWRELNTEAVVQTTPKIQTINLEKFSEEECKTAFAYPHQPNILREGLDYETQMCYGSRYDTADSCQGKLGEPLLIKTQFSRCIYTIVGVTSFRASRCSTPEVFTRVAHYKPWIESVVWA